MTEKRFVTEDGCSGYYTEIIDNEKELDLSLPNPQKNLTIEELVNLLNDLSEENGQLKQEVEFWKQVASQYSNELNVFEHCKKYKTEYDYLCEVIEKIRRLKK